MSCPARRWVCGTTLGSRSARASPGQRRAGCCIAWCVIGKVFKAERKYSRRYIPQMQAPGVTDWYLRSVQKEARGLWHAVRCVRVPGRAARDVCLQPFSVSCRHFSMEMLPRFSRCVAQLWEPGWGRCAASLGSVQRKGEQEGRNWKCLFLPL